MSDKNWQNIYDIIEAAEKIRSYTMNIKNADHLFSESMVFDAAMMNFIVIGKSVSRMSDNFISSHTEINWYKIKGLRNIIAHDYFGIDAEEIWQIIIKDIPGGLNDLNEMISKKYSL